MEITYFPYRGGEGLFINIPISWFRDQTGGFYMDNSLAVEDRLAVLGMYNADADNMDPITFPPGDDPDAMPAWGDFRAYHSVIIKANNY